VSKVQGSACPFGFLGDNDSRIIFADIEQVPFPVFRFLPVGVVWMTFHNFAQPLIIKYFRSDIVILAAFSGDFASSLISGENNAHLYGNIVWAAVYFVFNG
jgi:hypothetical protein